MRKKVAKIHPYDKVPQCERDPEATEEKGGERGREGGRRVFREERDREHSMKREILSLQERESKVRQGRKEREEV